MKKKSLLFSILALGAMFSTEAQEVVFNFNDVTSLTYAPQTLAEMKVGTYNNGTKDVDRLKLDGNNYLLITIDETISMDGVSFTTDKGSTSFPRLFFQNQPKQASDNPADYISDYRWYKGATTIFTAPEGKYFKSLMMYPKDASKDAQRLLKTIIQTEGGKQELTNELNSWVANEGVQLKELTYKADDDAPTQVAYKFVVTLGDINGSAVAEIAADDNAPSEYFDLTGNRHAADNLAPGLYIVKKGSQVKKVLVK